MPSGPNPVHVHVEAHVRLASAGLTRAAERAGLRVVPTEEPAPITLRAVTRSETQPGLDVFVGNDRIEIALDGAPSPVAWNAILRLLHELLNTGA